MSFLSSRCEVSEGGNLRKNRSVMKHSENGVKLLNDALIVNHKAH